MTAITDQTMRAVIRVGDGRGFVVEGCEECDRLIITAAHCLPYFPPCASFSLTEERTYPSLVGPLGMKPSVWAECLFVDPIGDVAVLGAPDNQAIPDEWEDYIEMLDEIRPLSISEAPEQGTANWLSSMGGGRHALSSDSLAVRFGYQVQRTSLEVCRDLRF